MTGSPVSASLASLQNDAPKRITRRARERRVSVKILSFTRRRGPVGRNLANVTGNPGARPCRDGTVFDRSAGQNGYSSRICLATIRWSWKCNVTCPDCLDFVIKGSRRHDDDKLISMPDDDFQCAIVDTLYSVNYELSMAQGFIGSLE